MFILLVFSFISRRNFISSSILATSLSSDSLINNVPQYVYDGPEIYLYDDVTAETMLQLKYMIQTKTREIQSEYKNIEKQPFINLHIQSYGGSAISALYMYDWIKKNNIKLRTYIDGISTSAASILSVSGENRVMTTNSLMLIHQPSIILTDKVKYKDLKDDTYNLELILSSMINIYKENSNMSETQIKDLILNEEYLSSKMCLKYGLVDGIV